MTDIARNIIPPARAWRTGLARASLLAARTVGTIGASVMMLLGLVLLPLPIPLGLPFLAVGGFILWQSCPPVRGRAHAWLEAHPGVRARGHAAVSRFRRRPRG